MVRRGGFFVELKIDEVYYEYQYKYILYEYDDEVYR